MKVLQIINSMATGGAEKLLLETIPLYRKRGIEMDLLLLDEKDSPFLQALRTQTDCKIIGFGTGSCYNPLLIFKMIPHFKNYDIVHVHLFPALYWVGMAKTLSFGKTKFIYTEHSTGNKRRTNPVLGLIDRMIYKGYDQVICISEEVKTSLMAHLKSGGKRFSVIGNGVNLDKINQAKPYTAQEFPLADGKNTLLIQVSSFIPPKDQATPIRALALLPETVHLILVGQGHLLEECRELALKIGVAPRVHFLNIRMDVPQLLKTSDIVLLSSKFEGVSLSSIEGLASGRPFVAADAPGLSEIVSGAGELFALENEQELAAVIDALITDQAHYQAVVQRCVDRAKDYGIDLMIDQHIRFYKTLI